MKMIVELIRHGETELQGRYQGAVDVPLSREGRQKLTAGRESLSVGRESLSAGRISRDPAAVYVSPLNAGRISRDPAAVYISPLNAGRISRDPAAVYVSPLKRARETASILFPEAAQIVIPGLAEMNFGKFEGKNFKEMENDPEYRAWVDGMCLGRCPGGESREEFCSRICDAFLQVLRLASEKETETLYGVQGTEDSRIVIVAHGGTQMAVMSSFNRFEDTGHKDRSDVSGEEKGESSADDYYSWQLSCGKSYVLEVQTEGTECCVHVLGIRDYCAPK